jgi:fucose 4-O-acetylase-like acetyltransferase
MMTQYNLQVGAASNQQQHSHSISELTVLKITALVLLIFVHSDLLFAYPKIMQPIEWFLLSVFFFVGGYLAYSSFQKRNRSLKEFFKSKALTLYVPFLAAILTYLFLDVYMGAKIEPAAVVSQVSMLNIFATLNTAYNWGTLWFIPFMLLFMVITCVLEKYVRSTKKQLLAITTLLAVTTFLWIHGSPLRLDALFNQYLLIFVFGFYISKFGLYNKLMTYKTVVVAAPIVALFAIDLSGFLNYNNPLNALVAQTYFNCRSIMLTMSLVLLTLYALRKVKLPVNGFAKQIADHSAFIYLTEPFISFLILTYVFGQGENFFAGGLAFYLYQATRIIVLLGVIPLAFIAWRYRPRMPMPAFAVKVKVAYKNLLVKR